MVRTSDGGRARPLYQRILRRPNDCCPTRTKAIELWPCAYDAPCKFRNCRLRATTIARGIDAGGRPRRQYELRATHANRVAERVRSRGTADYPARNRESMKL